MWIAFANAKNYSHFFSKNISVYGIFHDQNFNYTLTNDFASFEQLGPAYSPDLCLCVFFFISKAAALYTSVSNRYQTKTI